MTDEVQASTTEALDTARSECRAAAEVATARLKRLLFAAFDDSETAYNRLCVLVRAQGVERTAALLERQRLGDLAVHIGFPRGRLFGLLGPNRAAREALRELPDALRDQMTLVHKFADLTLAWRSVREREDSLRLQRTVLTRGQERDRRRGRATDRRRSIVAMDILALLAQAIATAVYWATVGILHGAWWLARTFGKGLARLVRRRSTTFGSARWATLWELWWGGVWGGKGLIVGQAWGRFLRFNQDGYVILFAPTRTGKGVGVVIPNLLSYQGSVVCTDPKGENSAITARYRATLGEVVTLNAIEPELSDTFNPLDMIRLGTIHEADDALELARLLIIPDSSGGGHWDNRATQLLQGLILYTCHRYAGMSELRNLAKVRSLVALGWGGLEGVFTEASRLGPTTLREIATGFTGMDASEEAKSILSTADKAISLWGADRPAGMVSATSSFDFRAFNRRTMTCFVMVDEEKLPISAGFLRVMMGCALVAMTRAKSEAPPKVPTLLLFDEAAAMGRIEPLETGVGYLATYARLILVFQDLDQIQRTYPKARSMIANAGCKVAFGVNDIETARMLADTIGHTTTVSRSTGESQRNVDLVQQQLNQGRSEAGRYLRDPSEIMRMPRHRAMVFFNGPVTYPVMARKVRYFRVWRWFGRWDKWRPRRATVLPFRPQPPSGDVQAAA
eukprot:gene17099-17290_t